MKTEKIQLASKSADGYIIDFGPVKLVFAKTNKGIVGCGIIDIATFEKFGFPAVKVKAAEGSINTLDDLLKASAVSVNAPAVLLGIKEGFTGKETLERM
ncbi:MAG: YunC family protein [Candidatus Saganbacteria bacterium]|nr:YunC family protein [Candidatus Saganbacteria bacterium]